MKCAHFRSEAECEMRRQINDGNDGNSNSNSDNDSNNNSNNDSYTVYNEITKEKKRHPQ